MKKHDQERVTELIIDEWIWIVFIILSILNISGDEIEKKFCYNHNQNDKTKAKKIFKFTVFISFLIYSYIAYKNYNKYKKTKYSNQDNPLISMRLFASILIVVASAILLYTQLKDTEAENPSIE